MWAALALVKVLKLRSRTSFSLSRSVWGYLASGVLMGVVVRLVGSVALAASLHAVEYGLRLVLLVALGAGVYFGVLSSFDRNVRGYAAAVLKSVR
jgi:uncharacterized membrane-anchored protein